MKMNIKFLLAAGIVAALCPAFAGVTASGGDMRILGSNEYAVHAFTNGGTFTVTQSGEVEVLLVGGGGGGGSASTGGGGGGGGGFVERTINLAVGTYQIAVGAGGKGASISGSTITAATNGGDSSLKLGDEVLLIAHGGGAGGCATRVASLGTSDDTAGKVGGSGGGSATHYHTSVSECIAGGAGIDGEGYGGGSATNATKSSAHVHAWAGGGGGAGERGHDAVVLNWTKGTGTPGSGGDGRASSITGVEVYYGGGGGGGAADYAYNEGQGPIPVGTIPGGAGGGGNGSRNYSSSKANVGLPGTDGLGGGGGGAGCFAGYVAAGGAGGSGVVFLRYRLDAADFSDRFKTAEAIGGSEAHRSGYRIFTFRTNGTFRVTGCSRAEVLLVGGGGGGGCASTGGGGGGAGGFVHRDVVMLPEGEYAVVVGAGGAGAAGQDGRTETETAESTWPIAPATNGWDSSFAGIVAYGGGAGGSDTKINSKDGDTTVVLGKDGASGGGATLPYFTVSSVVGYPGGSGIDGQGYGGGSSTNAVKNKTGGHIHCWAGGGGGAGERGHDAVATALDAGLAGEGGDGLPCSITGSEVYYAGGGGGGFADYSSAQQGGTVAGGKGGGGAGSGCKTTVTQYPGLPGTDGLGGGGGGGGGFSYHAQPGGKGGSGVVIIRCKVNPSGMAIVLQ